MHLLPIGVLRGAPGNFVSTFEVFSPPIRFKPILVALGLSEVVFVARISLDTPVARVLIRNSQGALDVLEIFAVLGIEEICQVLSLPDRFRERVDLVIEIELTSQSVPLGLHGAVGYILEIVVIAGGDSEHEGRPSNDPGLVHVVFTLTIFLEVLGLPLEALKEVFHL
jgi:hypothetical protein